MRGLTFEVQLLIALIVVTNRNSEEYLMGSSKSKYFMWSVIDVVNVMVAFYTPMAAVITKGLFWDGMTRGYARDDMNDFSTDLPSHFYG